MKDVTWHNHRPSLLVEHGTSAQLGSCYSSSTYIVTATNPLDAEQIAALRTVGILGYGQEFYIRGQQIDGQIVPVAKKLDWQERSKVKPSGVDAIAPKVRCRSTGKWLNEKPVNAYTGLPVTSTVDAPYFVYVVESRVDSSD